jgi:hypothetical protein
MSDCLSIHMSYLPKSITFLLNVVFGGRFIPKDIG